MARRSKALVAMARERDQRIVDSWLAHAAVEPGISTERLFELVKGDTGAEPGRQIPALQRAGILKEQ